MTLPNNVLPQILTRVSHDYITVDTNRRSCVASSRCRSSPHSGQPAVNAADAR
jgi:hypothetical protein